MSLSITIYTSHWSCFSGEPWLIHTCIILSNLDEHKTRLSSEETSQRQGVCSSHGISDLAAAATAAKSPHLCPTLCDPIDSSPPGSPVPGILQTSTLEWVAISFSKAWKWKVKVKSLSRVRPSTTPWTAAHQAPPSMGFSRQEYWSGMPLPSPSDLEPMLNNSAFHPILNG